MATKKRRRMTNAEKKERAEIKKRLQEEGFLPPDKPRLDRKRFLEEAEKEWNSREPGGHCLGVLSGGSNFYHAGKDGGVQPAGVAGSRGRCKGIKACGTAAGV